MSIEQATEFVPLLGFENEYLILLTVLMPN